jgi:methylmalonyl-CoA carboxyltransferase small subunit
LKLKITVDGKVYEVEVEATEQDSPLPSYLMPVGRTSVPAVPVGVTPSRPRSSPAADESKVCRSPISGVVVRVSTQVGQAIQINDALLLLEAMKMETAITSPITGKVAKVNVNVGDPVQAGQILIEFE